MCSQTISFNKNCTWSWAIQVGLFLPIFYCSLPFKKSPCIYTRSMWINTCKACSWLPDRYRHETCWLYFNSMAHLGKGRLLECIQHLGSLSFLEHKLCNGNALCSHIEFRECTLDPFPAHLLCYCSEGIWHLPGAYIFARVSEGFV